MSTPADELFCQLTEDTFSKQDVNDKGRLQIMRARVGASFGIFAVSDIERLLQGDTGNEVTFLSTKFESRTPSGKNTPAEVDECDPATIRFVVDTSGVIWLAREGSPNRYTPAHTEMTNGSPVLSAGNIYFSDDWQTITGFSNKSGGFKPSAQSLTHLLPLFAEGVLPDSIQLAADIKVTAYSGVSIDKSRSSSTSPAKLLRHFQQHFSESDVVLKNQQAQSRTISTEPTPQPARLALASSAAQQRAQGALVPPLAPTPGSSTMPRGRRLFLAERSFSGDNASFFGAPPAAGAASSPGHRLNLPVAPTFKRPRDETGPTVQPQLKRHSDADEPTTPSIPTTPSMVNK